MWLLEVEAASFLFPSSISHSRQRQRGMFDKYKEMLPIFLFTDRVLYQTAWMLKLTYLMQYDGVSKTKAIFIFIGQIMHLQPEAVKRKCVNTL